MIVKAAGTLRSVGDINRHPIGGQKSIELRCDLNRLIYWMEHDRTLDARPDKIFLLKNLLVNSERHIKEMPRTKPRSAVRKYPRTGT